MTDSAAANPTAAIPTQPPPDADNAAKSIGPDPDDASNQAPAEAPAGASPPSSESVDPQRVAQLEARLTRLNEGINVLTRLLTEASHPLKKLGNLVTVIEKLAERVGAVETKFKEPVTVAPAQLKDVFKPLLQALETMQTTFADQDKAINTLLQLALTKK